MKKAKRKTLILKITYFIILFLSGILLIWAILFSSSKKEEKPLEEPTETTYVKVKEKNKSFIIYDNTAYFYEPEIRVKETAIKDYLGKNDIDLKYQKDGNYSNNNLGTYRFETGLDVYAYKFEDSGKISALAVKTNEKDLGYSLFVKYPEEYKEKLNFDNIIKENKMGKAYKNASNLDFNDFIEIKNVNEFTLIPEKPELFYFHLHLFTAEDDELIYCFRCYYHENKQQLILKNTDETKFYGLKIELDLKEEINENY